MNSERSDLDRALRTWFEDGPTVMSDRVVDGIAARIARQPQRRTWRLRGRTVMNTYTKLAAAAAAIVVVGFVGWQLLPSRNNSGGPPTAAPTTAPSTTVAQPTSAPSPTPAAIACQGDVPGCLGDIAAGTYSSANFLPKLSFTAGEGWSNSLDAPTIYELDPNVAGGRYVMFWSNAQLTDHIPTCEASPIPSAGTKADDWIQYLTSHPGLVTSAPKSVRFGAYTGTSILTTVKPGWTKTCPNLPWTSVQYLMNADPVAGTPTYGAASGQRTRNYFVDVAGKTIVIQVYTDDLDSVDAAAMRTIQPLVDSVRFTP